MVGIQGIAGVPDPAKPDRSASSRDSKRVTSGEENSTASDSDDLTVSNEAQAAVKAVDALKIASTQPDIRADRVEAAKAAIERGDYKKTDIISTVAQRIDKYL